MTKVKIDTGDWIVICDGKKALILENVGDYMYPNLKTREVHQHNDPATRELGSDAPGRTYQSVGTARSAVEQTDLHAQSERDFLHGLMVHLDKAVMSGSIKHITLVAPPRPLGVIRQSCPPSLRRAIQTEIHGDYVRLPIYEIEQRLFG